MYNQKGTEKIISEKGMPSSILYKEGTNFSFLQYDDDLFSVNPTTKIFLDLLAKYRRLEIGTSIPYIKFHVYNIT